MQPVALGSTLWDPQKQQNWDPRQGRWAGAAFLPGFPQRLKTATHLHYGPLTSSGTCKSPAVNDHSLTELYIHTI